MSRKYYAMDTSFFHELGNYPLAVRCEMLGELGFDGSYLTLWDQKIEEAWKDAGEIAEMSRRQGLEVTSIYATLDLDGAVARDRLLNFIPDLPPGCALELSLISQNGTFTTSSESGDDAALRLLEPLLEAVDPERNPVCLYAHLSHWLGRHQDALRLIRKSDHPALGWVFSSYHWLASQEGQLIPLLREGIGSLRRVNLCGSRRAAGSYTLEPLDTGTLDLAMVFGQIAKHGFKGPVGIQGCGVGGDVYGNLKRGLSILKDWDKRFERHPHWADLLPIPLTFLDPSGNGPLL